MLQLVYISTPRGPVTVAALQQILSVSRRNNARDGITGLLFYDGARFLQALEGEADVVTTAFERIRADPKHMAVVILSKREIEAREFGPWSMASRTAVEGESEMLKRVSELVADASPTVQATFNSFAQVRKRAA
jgi:hypothetical protein